MGSYDVCIANEDHMYFSPNQYQQLTGFRNYKLNKFSGFERGLLGSL